MHDRRPLVRLVEDIAWIKSSMATDNAEVASAPGSATTKAMVGEWGEVKKMEVEGRKVGGKGLFRSIIW